LVKPVATQVVTVHPDGSISGLQRKPGQGFDLRTMGHAQIRRASEVIWDDMCQRWYVAILEPPFRGRTLDRHVCRDSGVNLTSVMPESALEWDRAGCAMFFEYDDAVKAEIAVLDGLRVRGKLQAP
jgi:hypothetical protein